MKKCFLLMSAIAIFGITAIGQSSTTVPANVKEGFTKKYPTAYDPTWKQSDDGWGAEFQMDGKNYRSNFDAQGNWVDSEYDLKSSDVPSNVRSTLNKEYEGYRIDNSYLSENAKGKVYRFEVSKDGDQKTVKIDPNGNVVKWDSHSDMDTYSPHNP